MLCFNRNEKVTCEKCRAHTTKGTLYDIKRWSVGTLHYTEFPRFSTRSQADVKFLDGEKHSLSQTKNFLKVNFVNKYFLAFIPSDYITEGAQRTNCIGEQKYGRDTFCGRD